MGGPIVAHPSNRDISLTMGESDLVKKTIDGGLHGNIHLLVILVGLLEMN